MGRCPEPDPDGPFGPGNGVGLHQLLDAVLPDDPGMHPLRDGRRGDGQLPHLLGLQASGVTLGDAGSFGSLPQVIGRVFGEVTVMALGDPSGFKVGACPHLIRAAIGLRQRRAR
jgi:hypothetical protein